MEDQRKEEAWFETHREEIDKMYRNGCCCSVPSTEINTQQRILTPEEMSQASNEALWSLALLGMMVLFGNSNGLKEDQNELDSDKD